MKLTKKIVLLALTWPAISFAGLNLPEPAALLQKAAVSRSALLDTTLAIEFNIPEMRDPATFDKYFFLMDNLKTMAQESGLENYYPQVIEKLALNMVGNGIRWLDLTKVTPAKLSYYVKWMDADTLGRLLSLVEYQMSTVKDPVLLKAMVANVDAVLPLVDIKAASLPYVQLGYRRLMSDAAVAVLKTENFTNEEFSFWLSKIKVSTSFSEYLDYLNVGVYSLDASKRVYGHIYLYRLTLLLAETSQLSEVPPNWLLNAIGDALSETILRMIRMEEPFSQGEFPMAIQQLKSRHLQTLAQQLMAADKLPSEAYVAQYLELSNAILARMKVVGLAKDAADFNKWIAKTAAPIMATAMNLEGQYELRNKKGDIWILTLAMAKENTLIAGVGTPDGAVYKTFFNVSYNAESKKFIASEREPDNDQEQNPTVEFTITNGTVSLYDPFVRTDYKIFVGTRTATFENVLKLGKPNSPALNGTYAGTFYLPNGKVFDGRLIITSFNGYTLGRLDSRNFTIDFTVGTEDNRGVVVLTSGRKSGSSWLQVRGVATKTGDLNVCLIVAGQGQGDACSLLKKVIEQ